MASEKRFHFLLAGSLMLKKCTVYRKLWIELSADDRKVLAGMRSTVFVKAKDIKIKDIRIKPGLNNSLFSSYQNVLCKNDF